MNVEMYGEWRSTREDDAQNEDGTFREQLAEEPMLLLLLWVQCRQPNCDGDTDLMQNGRI